MEETAPVTPTIPTPSQPLTWSVLEFEHRERHPDWLWYAGLIFAIAATISFFYANIFFGIFLIVAGAAIILFAQRRPKMLSITLDEKDITVDNERILYERVTQFWIDETGKPDMLLLLIKGSFTPMMAIPLANVTAQSVRSEMLKHAPETMMRESMGSKIAERLGF